MARTFTRAELRTRARMLANLRSTSFPTDAEVNELINTHYCEMFDALVQAGPPEYYAVKYQVNTVASTIQYAVPANFRSLTAVYSIESTTSPTVSGAYDNLRPVDNMTVNERTYFKSPQGVYPMLIEYIPAPEVTNASCTSSDTTTYDGVSGWEELIVANVARDMLVMEGSPISPAIENKIAMLSERVKRQASNRDKGRPRRIEDVEANSSWSYPYTSGVRAYRLFAGYIEFYEPTVPFP